MKDQNIESTLTSAGKWLLKIIVPLLGALLSVLVPESVIHKIAQALTQDQWLRLTIASFVTLLILFAYIGYLLWQKNKKPNFKDYIFDPLDRCWRHKIKEEWLCATCKTENIFSPLAFDDGSGMFCPKCGKKAKNLKLENMRFVRELSPSVKLENFAKRENT